MRTYTLLLAAALMTLVCVPALAGELELINKGGTEDVYRVSVNPDVEPFQFHLIFGDDPDYRAVTEMKVYRGDELLQTIPVEMAEPPYDESKAVEMKDMNRDGYGDIRVLMWWGATGNEGWSYWLYNPEKDRFEYNEQLSSIYARGYDDQGRVVSWGVGGHAGLIYTYSAYEWRGAELVLVYKAREDYDNESGKYHKVVSELRDGRMVVVSDRLLTEDEARSEGM